MADGQTYRQADSRMAHALMEPEADEKRDFQRYAHEPHSMLLWLFVDLLVCEASL